MENRSARTSHSGENAQIASATRGGKLLYFLTRMDIAERQSFRHYLESPLLGNSKQLSRLFRIVEKHLSQSDPGLLPAELFYPELFPDGVPETGGENYVWVRISLLTEKLMDFLAFQEYQQDELMRERLLLRAFKRRSLTRFLPAVFRRAMRKTGKQVSAGTVQQRMSMQIEWADHLVTTGVPGGDTGIAEVMESTDLYWVIQKLKYATGEYMHRATARKTIDLHGVELALEMAAGPRFREIAIVQGYVHACNMIRALHAGSKQSEGHLQQLLGLLEEPEKFERSEGRDLYFIAQNFLVLKHYQGDSGAINALTQLYAAMLDSGLMTEAGTVSATFYKNTVMLMCRLGSFDWVAGFMGQYHSRIRNDPKGLTAKFNWAVLAFYREDWSRVIELLYNEINRFANPAIGLDARVYLCRALWMQGEYDWLLGMLDGYRQYLKRNKAVSALDRKVHGKYVRYFRKLALAVTERQDKRERKLRELLKEMENAGDESVLGWLGGQIRKQAERPK